MRTGGQVVAAFWLTVALATGCENGDGSTDATTSGGGGNSGLVVLGGNDLFSSGPEGGPFVETVDYGITNQGSTDLQWVALASDSWIQLSSVAGTLSPGQTQSMTVSVNGAVANGLVAGAHVGTVTFRDQAEPAADVVRPATLSVQTPAGQSPVIDSIAPLWGPYSGGNMVTLSGSGFDDGTPTSNLLMFGATMATNVQVVDDTTITAMVPPGTPGTDVDVLYTNDDGSTTRDRGYGYNAVPTLDTVTPASGPAFGGNTVMLEGSGFQARQPGINVVTFGGVEATNVVVSGDKNLTCEVPAGAPGSVVDILLTNDNGQVLLPGAYSYSAPPILVSVTPASGPDVGGNAFTLRGAGFLNADPTSVSFGGTPATGVVVVDDTTVNGFAPTGTAGQTVDVALSNLNGSATLVAAYAYQGSVALTSVTPNNGSASGGNNVTLTGRGFQAAGAGTNTVRFGATTATNLVVVSDTTLRCDVPSGAPGTMVDVVVTNGNGSASLPNGYGYQSVAVAVGSVNPSAGPATGGNSVTVAGAGFQIGVSGAVSVSFGGNAAGNVLVLDDSTLTCTVPAGTAGSSVDVVVSNSNGTDTLANGYAYRAAPTLTTVNPSSGSAAGGNTVTLSGSGFQSGNPGTNMVTFGGVAATSVVVQNDSTLTCVVPAGAAGTSVGVALSNANGADSLSNAYAYNAGPNLTAINPASGPAAGGTSVTLVGTGFLNGGAGQPTVVFGGAAAGNIVVVDDQTVTCSAPAGSAGSAVTVVLTNANGTDFLSNGFVYHAAPALTSVTPASGPEAGGNTASLSGSGFQDNSPGATSVSFGGIEATNVVVSSDTLLTCEVPAGAGGSSVDLVVSNANGTGTLPNAYAFVGVPALTAVNPTAGPAAGGNTVTLFGSGFQNGNPGVNTITFDGVAAANVAVQSDTSLTCVAPAGAMGTTVDVVLSNANGSDTLANAYSYTAGVSLTSLAPTSGPSSGGTRTTLTGTGFQSGAAGQPTVTFGGISAGNIVVVSDLTVMCDAPPGSPGSSVDVILTNGNGSDTLFNGFDYEPAPTLTAVTPSSGPPAGGNTVTLTGAGFQNGNPGANNVTFDGVAASNVAVSSDTQLACQVPGGLAGTAVVVEVSNDNGSSSMAGAYAYEVPATVTPAGGFSASGDEGGPFAPDSAVYNLTNTGSVNLDWAVSISDTFVYVDGPTSGSLSPGQSMNVTLRLAAVTALFMPGTYSATATFANAGEGEVVAVRDVDLTVTSMVDGWTEFTASADTRRAYVSNNGSDSNDGLSPITPKRTIAAGKALMRDGFPDWLLLQRGSTWSESIGFWSTSGRSSTEMALVGDYGDPAQPRPTLNVPGDNGLTFDLNDGAGVRHVAVVGIQFNDGNLEGLNIEDILIENCRFTRGGLLLRTSGQYPNQQPRNVRVRRCVIHDNPGQGIYTHEARDFLFEEVIFYNNGLADQVRNHNIYMSGSDPESTYAPNNQNQASGNVVRGCFLLKAGGNFGLKWRVQDNGLIERNVFSRNRNAAQIHTKWPNELAINNVFRENVLVEQGNPDAPSSVHGLLLNGVQQAVVSDNIFSKSPFALGGGNPAILLNMPNREEYPEEVGNPFPSPTDVQILNNIVYDWTGTQLIFGNAAQGDNEYSGIEVRNNHFQNEASTSPLVVHTEPIRLGANGVIYSGNRYWTAGNLDRWYEVNGAGSTYAEWVAMSTETGSTNNQIGYSDPDRDLGDYAASLGLGATFDSFVGAILLQEKGNWNEALMAEPVINYIRQGFDLAPLAP